MRRLCLGVMLLGALACVLPEGKGQAPANKDIDATKLGPGVFSGKLVSLPDSDRMFTVAVQYPEIVPNPNYKPPRNIQQEINRINQLQAQAARSRNPRQVQNDLNQINQLSLQLQRQIAQAQANAVKIVQRTANVDFQAEEVLKVRIKDLPEVFDDKGNVRKYTAEELKELKGKDKDLPGYESTADALAVGQTVQVVLKQHHAPKPPPPDAKKDEDKEKSKDKDTSKDTPKDTPKDKPKEGSNEKKMQVQVILILDASTGNSSPGTPPKKKKN